MVVGADLAGGAGGCGDVAEMQGRHMERSGSKRALDPGGSGGGGDDDERDPKRPRVPALAR